MKWGKLEQDIKSGRVLSVIINKQLERFNVTIDDVNGVDRWYDKYTVTKEQNREWREYCVEWLRKEYGMPKYRAEREMSWVEGMWGLRVEGI